MKTITFKNIPDQYFEWLKEQSLKSGVTVSSLLKILIRDEMSRDQNRFNTDKVDQ